MNDEALSKLQSKDIEEALVGAVIQRGDLLDELDEIQVIAGSYFQDVLLGKLWDHIISLWVDETPIDVLTLSQGVKNDKDFQDAGGVSYLTKLITTVPTTMHAEAYAKFLKRNHAKRTTIRALESAVSDILEDKNIYATDTLTNVEGYLLDAATQFDGMNVTGLSLTISAPDLASLEFANEAYVIEESIYTGGVHLIAGDVASGKTWIAMEIAIAVASGGVCMAGKQARGPLNVVYFTPDNRRRTMQARLTKTCLARNIEIPTTLFFCEEAFDLSSLTGQKALSHIVERHDAQLIILDVLDDFYGPHADENKATDIKPIIRVLTKVGNRFDTASIALTHTNKASGVKSWIQKVRGSVAITGAQDGSWLVQYNDNKDLRTMIHTKNRDNPRSKPQEFTLVDLPNGGVAIDWTDYTGSAEGNPLAAATASLIMEYLKSKPGQSIKSAELKGMLKAKDAVPSKPTYDMASDVVAKAQGFERTDYQRGKPYEYTYNANHSE